MHTCLMPVCILAHLVFYTHSVPVPGKCYGLFYLSHMKKSFPSTLNRSLCSVLTNVLCNLWSIGINLSVFVWFVLTVKIAFLVLVSWTKTHSSCYISGFILLQTLFIILMRSSSWLSDRVHIYIHLVTLTSLRYIWDFPVFCHCQIFHLSFCNFIDPEIV